MVSTQYSNAISEVLDILNHTKKEDVDKIPTSFLKFLEENKSKDYIPNIDHTKRIKDMNLQETTIGILSVINSKFWCNEEEKKIFEEHLKENEIKYQKELREKYNPDEIFKQHVENEMAITKVEEKSFIEKIIDKIKNRFFKGKKNI